MRTVVRPVAVLGGVRNVGDTGNNAVAKPASVAREVRVIKVDGIAYVPLDQARAMVSEASAARQTDYVGARSELGRMQELLDSAVSERSRVEKELRKALEDRVALEKRVKAAVMAQTAAEDAEMERQRYALEAAAALEGRLRAAYERQNKAVVEGLKEQLQYAASVATQAEMIAIEALAAAEMRGVTAADAAVQVLEAEVGAELMLAKTAVDSAREAAALSSLAARSALLGQQEALDAADSLRGESRELSNKAAAAHTEARALDIEVQKLRDGLTDAQRQAAEAIAAMTDTELVCTKRTEEAQREALRQIEEARVAYEKLRDAAEGRAAMAEETAAAMSDRVSKLTAEVQNLRGTMATAQSAAAHATSRLEQIESEKDGTLAMLHRHAQEDVRSAKERMTSERMLFEVKAQDEAAARVADATQQLEERLHQAHDGLYKRLEVLQGALSRMNDTRDYWKGRAGGLEQELAQLAAQIQAEADAVVRASRAVARGRGGVTPKRGSYREYLARGHRVRGEEDPAPGMVLTQDDLHEDELSPLYVDPAVAAAKEAEEAARAAAAAEAEAQAAAQVQMQGEQRWQGQAQEQHQGHDSHQEHHNHHHHQHDNHHHGHHNHH